MHYVYVLQSEVDGRFYTGCTADLRKRFQQHNDGKVQATQQRAPFKTPARNEREHLAWQLKQGVNEIQIATVQELGRARADSGGQNPLARSQFRT
jgi:hypothetical protein